MCVFLFYYSITFHFHTHIIIAQIKMYNYVLRNLLKDEIEQVMFHGKCNSIEHQLFHNFVCHKQKYWPMLHKQQKFMIKYFCACKPQIQCTICPNTKFTSRKNTQRATHSHYTQFCVFSDTRQINDCTFYKCDTSLLTYPTIRIYMRDKTTCLLNFHSIETKQKKTKNWKKNWCAYKQHVDNIYVNYRQVERKTKSTRVEYVLLLVFQFFFFFFFSCRFCQSSVPEVGSLDFIRTHKSGKKNSSSPNHRTIFVFILKFFFLH